jgi:flagellar motor switch protein FliN/FliY
MAKAAKTNEKNEEKTSAKAEKTQVQTVQYPDAGADKSTGQGGKLDILLDMNIPVTVNLGQTQIPIKKLMQLGPGSVLTLSKSVDEPVDLYLKDSKFAQADVVVVENCFAVKIKQIVGAETSAQQE